MTEQTALIAAEQFGYRYRRDAPWAVHDLNLRLEAGAWLVVVGASGAGKSTLARALNGTVPHFFGGQLTGTLTVCGLDPAETPMHVTVRSVGVVLQDPPAQLVESSVARELLFGLESLGLAATEMRARVEALATALEIETLLSRAPQQLSGGEQQLVLIAAFLAMEPRLLVLDEPLTMLDARARRRVLAALHAAQRRGTGLVVIDHRLDDYAGVADLCALMEAGTISEQGALSTVVDALLRRTTPPVELPAAARWWRRHLAPLLQEGPGGGVALQRVLLEEQLEQLPAPLLARLGAHFSSQRADDRRVPPGPASGEVPAVEWRNVVYAYQPGQAGRRWTPGKLLAGLPALPAEGALRGINARLWPGEVVAVLGPNGAGKSTLLRTLNGLVRPQQGAVYVDGRLVGERAVADLARCVGYAPQRPERLFFCDRLAEELLVGARALGVVQETAAWRARLVELLELGPLLECSPFALSAGQQRRLALAAVLAARPRVVALDEPTVGLDAAGRAVVANLLRELADDGATVLLATHDLEFAAAVATRWLVLVDGRLVADDRPARILADEALLRTAALDEEALPALELSLSRRLSDLLTSEPEAQRRGGMGPC
jgi:energy-coupling factor transporter ATP-binding protein EcfA2